MLTIKEIARLAGVSRGTVDRVLNQRGGVKPETEEKIRGILQALDYSPNLAGKTLAVKKKQLKLGFILFSSANNPFFLDVERGIQSREEVFAEYGASILQRHTPIDDPDAQVAAIDELMRQGISGLAITPISHPAVADKLRSLSQLGLPVIAVNSDIEGCGRLAYVGSNYYNAGATAAGLISIISGGKARVGIVAGSRSVLCHTRRIAGFIDCCGSRYPDIRASATVINDDDDIVSYRETSAMLAAHSEIDALYLVSAGIVGACRAVMELPGERRVKIVCHDRVESTCVLLKKGVIQAAILQEPYFQGKKPLELLMDYLGMGIKPEKEYYYTQSQVIIRENLSSADTP